MITFGHLQGGGLKVKFFTYWMTKIFHSYYTYVVLFFVGWLQQLESKVKNFLGDVEPVNLGWLYDPLRYLSAVNIRHLISSNLGSASTEFLITLSGIKDIHELKEGLHSGCYTNGNTNTIFIRLSLMNLYISILSQYNMFICLSLNSS